MNWKVTLSGSKPSKKVIEILIELTDMERTEVLLALKKGSLVAGSGLSKVRAENLAASLSKHRSIKSTVLPADDADAHTVSFRVVLVECEVGKRSRLRRTLQELAGIHHEQAVLWLSRIPFVIRKNVDNNTARQIKRTITDAGGIVRIEPELSSSGNKDDLPSTASAVLFEKEDISETVFEENTPDSTEKDMLDVSPEEDDADEQQTDMSQTVETEENHVEIDEKIEDISVKSEEDIAESVPNKVDEKQEVPREVTAEAPESPVAADADTGKENQETSATAPDESESDENVHQTKNADIADNDDEKAETTPETDEEIFELVEGIPEGRGLLTADYFRPPPKPKRKKRLKRKGETVIPGIFIPGKPPKSVSPAEFIAPPVHIIEKKIIIAPPVVRLNAPSTEITYCVPPVLFLEKKKTEVRKTPPPAAIVFDIPKTLVSGKNIPPSPVPDLPKRKLVYGIISPPPVLVFKQEAKLPLVSGIPSTEHTAVIPEEVPDLPDVSFELTAPPSVLVFKREPELPLVSGIPLREDAHESSPPLPEPTVEKESEESPPAIDFLSSATSLSEDPGETDLEFQPPPTYMKSPPDEARYSIYLCAPSDEISDDVLLALKDILLLEETASNDMLMDCPSWIASFRSIEKAREIAGKLEKRGATIFLDSRDMSGLTADNRESRSDFREWLTLNG